MKLSFSEAALGAEKDPVAGRARTGMTRRRTWTMRRPRVAGAEEGSRDLTVLATSGAEENPETTMALPPPETRRTVRYVLEQYELFRSISKQPWSN